jgi:hypothetical protein
MASSAWPSITRGAANSQGKKARVAAAFVPTIILHFFVLLHIPGMTPQLHDLGARASTCEVLALCGGSLVLAGTLTPEGNKYVAKGCSHGAWLRVFHAGREVVGESLKVKEKMRGKKLGLTTMRFTAGTSEKPVTETPGGRRPKSPATRLAPVFVTVVAPRTTKGCEEASGGADCAQASPPALNIQITNKTFFTS